MVPWAGEGQGGRDWEFNDKFKQKNWKHRFVHPLFSYRQQEWRLMGINLRAILGANVVATLGWSSGLATDRLAPRCPTGHSPACGRQQRPTCHATHIKMAICLEHSDILCSFARAMATQANLQTAGYGLA